MRKENRYAFFIGCISVIIGVFLLLSSFSKLQTYEKTGATVVSTHTFTTHARRARRHCYATLAYTVDGKNHEVYIEIKGPEKKEGDIMEIYYNPNNPSQVSYGYVMWVQPIIFMALGAFLVVAGKMLDLKGGGV